MAGCSSGNGSGGDGGPARGPNDTGETGTVTDTAGQLEADDRLAAQLEAVTDALEDDQQTAFMTAVATDGELTDRGERLLEQLAEIAELSASARTAVARSVADQGTVTDLALTAIERVQTGSPAFRRTVFQHGLAGVSSGVLAGEKRALGFEPAGYKSNATGLIRALAGDESGYTEQVMSYLRAVGGLSWVEWRQAEQLGLLDDAVTNGTVSTETIAALRDQSGDTMLDGFVETLGLNATVEHAEIARLTLYFAFDGITTTEQTYLNRVADRSTDQFDWAQAKAFIYRDAADGEVSDRDLRRLTDTSGDGLLDGFAERIGVDPTVPNDRIRPYAERLSEPFGRYTFNDVQYIRRLAGLSESDHLWAQATSLGLLGTEPVQRGAVTVEDRRQLNLFAPGVLNVTAQAIGLDNRPGAAGIVRRLSASLVGDSNNTDTNASTKTNTYTANEIAYLDRVVDIAQYRNNSYEYWAQAKQLGLLAETAATGEISDDVLWALQNNASNRLLNGMERAYGTDPERADTSGDGFPDHLVWGPMQDLGLNASPTAVDVYVEVEATEDAVVPADELATVTDLFATEPATTDPIRLHTYQFREDRAGLTTSTEVNEREATRSAAGYGLHYLLFQSRPFVTDEAVAGATQASFPERPQDRQSWMSVVTDLSAHGESTASRAATIAHEMGHKFGIREYHFAGVDSYQYSAEEYASVMNYRVTDQVTFSTGPPFNDYAQMAEAEFGGYNLDLSSLRAIWDNGDQPAVSFKQWVENSQLSTHNETATD